MILPTVRNLTRENRRLKRELVVARSTLAAVGHLVKCTSPAVHVRMAHQLEQAQARLAERDGIESHAASLEVEG